MITQSYLKELFKYDNITGYLIWKVDRGKSKTIGKLAGGVDKSTGYLRTGIDGKKYYNHRLVWLYTTGDYPKVIDHLNRNKLDNRLDNLRNVSQKENSRNTKIRTDNTSGVKGVCWVRSRNRWLSSIWVDGKSIHLGLFACFHEAVNARKNAESLYNYINLGEDL